MINRLRGLLLAISTLLTVLTLGGLVVAGLTVGLTQ